MQQKTFSIVNYIPRLLKKQQFATPDFFIASDFMPFGLDKVQFHAWTYPFFALRIFHLVLQQGENFTFNLTMMEQ